MDRTKEATVEVQVTEVVMGVVQDTEVDTEGDMEEVQVMEVATADQVMEVLVMEVATVDIQCNNSMADLKEADLEQEEWQWV
jgi:hypothetical protein